MDERQLIYEGYLRKSPPLKKIDRKWRKRYFRLWSDKKLEYFKNQIEATPLREGLDLTLCVDVIDTGPIYERHFKREYRWPFCIKMPHRDYHLLASSQQDQQNWTDKIETLCTSTTVMRVSIDANITGTVESSPNSSSSSRNIERSGSESSSNRYVSSCIPIPRESHFDEDSWASGSFSSTQYDELPPPRPAVDGDIFQNKYQDGSEAVYDVPPSSKQSFRKKQSSTKSSGKSSVTSELGYIQMESSFDTADQDDRNEEYIRMGVTPPEELANPSSVKEFKPFGTLIPNQSQLQSHTIPLPTSANLRFRAEGFNVSDDAVFYDISSMQRKNMLFELEPPLVDRNIKPSPAVDRTKKPKAVLADSKGPLKSSAPNPTGYMNVTSLSRQPDDYEMHNVTQALTPNILSFKQCNAVTANNSNANKEHLCLPASEETACHRTNNDQHNIDCKNENISSNIIANVLQKEYTHDIAPAIVCNYTGLEETKDDYMKIDQHNNEDKSIHNLLPNNGSYDTLPNDYNSEYVYHNISLASNSNSSGGPMVRWSGDVNTEVYCSMSPDNIEITSARDLEADTRHVILSTNNENTVTGDSKLNVSHSESPGRDEISLGKDLEGDLYNNILSISDKTLANNCKGDAYFSILPANNREETISDEETSLTTDNRQLEIADDKDCSYENASDINQNWQESNEPLEYIQCISSKLHQQERESFAADDISYVTVDAVKSAAATGLRN